MPDLIVIGAGPAGLTAAIAAARAGARVTVLEAGPAPGRKLLASGGGRCNLTNTLPPAELAARFGRQGRFLLPALAGLGGDALRTWLGELGVTTHAPDGFHVFPTGHRARDVLSALLHEMKRLGVELETDRPVTALIIDEGRIAGVQAGKARPARAVVLAGGGCGYPSLGGGLGACELAASCGHRLIPPHPGMVPLVTRETWPARCTADTIGHAVLRVRRPGKSRIEARGDLIFTRTGIAGPVVLDLAREVTPLLAAAGEVELEMELTGRDQDAWRTGLEAARLEAPGEPAVAWLAARGRVAPSLAAALAEQVGVEPDRRLEALDRRRLNRLAAVLGVTRLTVTGHAGWDRAMVMRGGVSLKDVRPESLASRRVAGLFLAGEMLDLDGPCGGFNLQWAFASGWLAGSAAGNGVRG